MYGLETDGRRSMIRSSIYIYIYSIIYTRSIDSWRKGQCHQRWSTTLYGQSLMAAVQYGRIYEREGMHTKLNKTRTFERLYTKRLKKVVWCYVWPTSSSIQTSLTLSFSHHWQTCNGRMRERERERERTLAAV